MTFVHQGSVEFGFDHRCLNEDFFNSLDHRIAQLGVLGIEADIIDTWDMSVTRLPETYEGSVKVNLDKQYMALRIVKA